MSAPADIAQAAAELLQHAQASAAADFHQHQEGSSSPMLVSRQHCEVCSAPLPALQQQQQQQEQEHPQQQQQCSNPLARKSLLPPDPPKLAGTTSVDAVFGGMLVSSIACTACGYMSVSYEPFLDLSLPIPLPEAAGGSLTRKVCQGFKLGLQICKAFLYYSACSFSVHNSNRKEIHQAHAAHSTG